MVGSERLQSDRVPRATFPGLALLGGLVATAIGIIVTTVLAVAVAASVMIIAVLGGALLLIAPMAVKARRVMVKAKARPEAGPQIIEARNVGGHSWVAYGWDQRR